jgi:hypothetical protein
MARSRLGVPGRDTRWLLGAGRLPGCVVVAVIGAVIVAVIVAV